MKVLLLMMKIVFCSGILLLVPTPVAVLIMALLILTLTLHNLKMTLGCYTFLTKSYDLVSGSLMMLTIWLIILMIIAQKSIEYKKY